MPLSPRSPFGLVLVLAAMTQGLGAPAAGPLPVGTESTSARPVPGESSSLPWLLAEIEASPEARLVLQGLPVGVEGGRPGWIRFDARPEAIEALEALGFSPHVLAEDTQDLRPSVQPAERGPQYHTPDSATAALIQLAALHPYLVRVVDLGRSSEGRQLTGVLITDNPQRREEDEPALRLLGTHHGDEWSSMEVTLAAVERLVESYPSDEGVQNLLDSNELWALPVVNPDGVVAFTRRNAQNVDLNRNYSYQWWPQSYSGPHPFSEVEADAVRALSWVRSFGHSLSVHSGATNLGWVWNYTLEAAVDEAWMEGLCNSYLDATDQPDFWITNGADWYITHGDTNDWSYGERGGHDYTLEVTLEKAPPADEIPEYLAYHVGPVVSFLVDGAAAGLRGRVVDPEGRGIEASLESESFPWPSYADPETGAFARPLSPGSYRVDFRAEGFQTQSVDLAVGAGEATEIEVVLDPIQAHSLRRVADLSHGPSGGESWICGESLVEIISDGGDVALWRAGMDPVAFSVTTKEDCILLEIDPGRIESAWQREGEFHLLVRDSEAQSVFHIPLALLLRAGDPSFSPTGVEVEPAVFGTHIVHVLGEDLPRGARIRAVGPQAQRFAPSDRLAEDHEDRISARFDPHQWPDGSYSLRVFGRGHWSSLEQALQVFNGEIVADPEVKTPVIEEADDPEVVTDPGEVDPDGLAVPPRDLTLPNNTLVAAGQGCLCTLSAGTRPTAARLALLALLVVGCTFAAARRRR